MVKKYIRYSGSIGKPKVKKKKDIAKIIANVDTLIVETKQDSLIRHSNVKGSLGNPSGGKIISESSTQIHFSEIGLSKIHAFFSKLDNIY